MVLPLYATLERLDPSLLEASADLGARPWDTLVRVTLPLCAPGIRAGAILVFVPCLGTYLTSDLLGGSKTVLIGNLVQNQFTASRDWPFGAALSLALMAIAMLLLFAARTQGRRASMKTRASRLRRVRLRVPARALADPRDLQFQLVQVRGLGKLLAPVVPGRRRRRESDRILREQPDHRHRRHRSPRPSSARSRPTVSGNAAQLGSPDRCIFLWSRRKS